MSSTVGGTAVTFLQEYFRGTKGPVYITALRNPKSELPGRELDKLLTRIPADIATFLTKHDKREQECGIYYCTATLKPGSKSRKADDCFQFISLFADVDDKNHALTRTQALDALEAMASPPTFIVNSGHGLQPHWLLSEPCEDAERIIVARKKLQLLVASDPVPDAPRLMRLPGSHNSKEGDWLPAQIVSHHPERRYALEAIEDWLDGANVAIPRKPEAKQKPNGNGAAFGKPLIVPSVGSSGTDHNRGAGWARTALEESYRELANTGEGSRHNILLKKTIRMHTMVARGWIDMVEVHRVLLAASEACGLIKDKGRGHFDQTFADGAKHGMAMPHEDLPDDAPLHSGINAGLKEPRAEPVDRPQQHQRSKASNNKGDATVDDTSGSDDVDRARLESICVADIEMAAYDWLWPGRFAVGKLGLIAGLPDEGKGQPLYYIASRVTHGEKWPCDEGIAPQGSIVILTAEDDLADTVKPRLAAAGADFKRVHILRMVRQGDKRRMFSLVGDLELLRQKIIEIGAVRMVMIDPISAYLGAGKIDAYRTTDVRAVLAPLVDLAEELRVAIIGVLHFNKKVDVTNALLRISDSLAFGATARHVYGVINDPEHKRKLFVRAKNNCAIDTSKTLAYRFTSCEVGLDRKTSKPIIAPYIVWDSQYVDVTATEAMQAATEGRTPAARDDAKKFLAELLAGGPALKTEIEEAAEANGISERTLFRAKAELKIENRCKKRRGRSRPMALEPSHAASQKLEWQGLIPCPARLPPTIRFYASGCPITFYRLASYSWRIPRRVRQYGEL